MRAMTEPSTQRRSPPIRLTRSGAIAAGAAGIDPKFVVMHQMWLGGGFGRRLDADMMVPAVQAAKAVCYR